MPLQKVREQFTKSELAIMGWRGSEIAYNMRSQANSPPRGVPNHHPTSQNQATGLPQGLNGESYGAQDEDIRRLEERLGPVVVTKLGGTDGQVDLRKKSPPTKSSPPSTSSINLLLRPRTKPPKPV